MTCASAECHEAGGNAPPAPEMPLDLTVDSDLYSRITTYVAKDCDNDLFIDPGHPESSAVIKVLSGPCGSVPQMPNGCKGDSCIPQDYIDALSDWIANGAPQN